MRPMKFILVCAALFAGCGKGEEPPPPSTGTPNSPQESGPSRHVRPPGGNGTDDKALGVFLATCAACHGQNGDGNGPAAANIDPKPRNYHDPKWQASVTDDDLKKTIQLGGRKVGKSPMMPGHPEYDDATLDGLVKIIREFGKQ